MDLVSLICIHLLLLLCLLGHISEATDTEQTARAVKDIKTLLDKRAPSKSWPTIPKDHLPFDSLRKSDPTRSEVCSECMANLLKWNIEVLPPGSQIWQWPSRPYLGHDLPDDRPEYRRLRKLDWSEKVQWLVSRMGKRKKDIVRSLHLAKRCNKLLGTERSNRCRAWDLDPELCTIWDPQYQFDTEGSITIPTYADTPPPSQAAPGRFDSSHDDASPLPFATPPEQKQSTGKRIGDGEQNKNVFTSTHRTDTKHDLNSAADAARNTAGRVLGGIVDAVQAGTSSAAHPHVPGLSPPGAQVLIRLSQR